jgi:hypothetical protein
VKPPAESPERLPEPRMLEQSPPLFDFFVVLILLCMLLGAAWAAIYAVMLAAQTP